MAFAFCAVLTINGVLGLAPFLSSLSLLMPTFFLSLGTALLVLFGASEKGPFASALSVNPNHAVSVDSLSFTVTAGDNLIIALPDSLAGQAVTTYRIAHPPALSWLHERSFVWKTHERDQGQHRLLFVAAPPSTVSDSLFVLITIE